MAAVESAVDGSAGVEEVAGGDHGKAGELSGPFSDCLVGSEVTPEGPVGGDVQHVDPGLFQGANQLLEILGGEAFLPFVEDADAAEE